MRGCFLGGVRGQVGAVVGRGGADTDLGGVWAADDADNLFSSGRLCYTPVGRWVRRSLRVMECWLTIEVQDADVPATLWRDGRGEALIEAAVTNGATEWQRHTPRWGVILEISFRDEAGREAYRALPAVQAALDAVPDPVRGLYVYPGRGGGALFPVRRPHRPTPLAGAAAVEEPREEQHLELEPRPTEEPIGATPQSNG